MGRLVGAALLLAATIAGAAALWLGPERAGRYALTGYLILSLSPYERVSPGAPLIQVLGDSTGYGTGAAAPEESIAGRIGAAYPSYAIRNDSVNGRTLAGLRARLEETGPPPPSALALLQIGGNDILLRRPLPAVRADLDAVLATLAPRADAVVMICCGNIDGETAADGTLAGPSRPYHALFADAAAARGVRYIDLSEPDATNPFVQDRDRMIALDGLHPSGAGYGRWFELIAPTLGSLLSTEAAPADQEPRD